MHALLVAMALAAAPPTAPPRAVTLSPSTPAAVAAPQVESVLLDEFRRAFDADAGRVRVVCLFSPS